MQVNKHQDNIWIVTPHVLESYTPDELVFQQRLLLSSLYDKYEKMNGTLLSGFSFM